jgi:hypothetical protein
METREKRQSVRLKASLPVSLEHLGINHHYEEELTRDISMTGFRVNISSFFPKDANFLIKLRLPEVNKMIEGIAKVVWAQHLARSNQYEAGLQFVELNPIFKNWIEEYVQVNKAMGN